MSFVAGKSFQDAISRATMIARRSQKQLEDLKRYESSMSNFFYATPLPSYVLDISGRVLDINQAWAQTFGFTHNEVIGRTTDTIRYWDKIEQRQKLNDALISNEPVITQRADLVVADGSVRTFQMTLAVIKSLDGIRLLVQLVDKTDRSKEEEAQRHYLDQLQRRIEIESGKLKVVPKE